MIVANRIERQRDGQPRCCRCVIKCNALIDQELLTDCGSAARDEVEPTRGQPAFGKDVTEDSTTNWRGGRGFDDHAVAGSKGRSDLVKRCVERRIEGSNRTHDTKRMANEIGEFAGTARTFQRHRLA
jgi:hypothetical protein